jgi:hypothetical protein
MGIIIFKKIICSSAFFGRRSIVFSVIMGAWKKVRNSSQLFFGLEIWQAIHKVHQETIFPSPYL